MGQVVTNVMSLIKEEAQDLRMCIARAGSQHICLFLCTDISCARPLVRLMSSLWAFFKPPLHPGRLLAAQCLRPQSPALACKSGFPEWNVSQASVAGSAL